MKTQPICFANYICLIWAEPDEGTYNYQIFPLRERWASTEPVEVPRRIVERIKAKASSFYPIMVVDGWDLDSYLDDLTTLGLHSSRIRMRVVFGDFPRIVVSDASTKHRNSVKEFLSEVKQRIKY